MDKKFGLSNVSIFTSGSRRMTSGTASQDKPNVPITIQLAESARPNV
jgi:hypothetical protein